MSTRILRVDGMTCNHCTMAVTKALKAVPGVKAVNVSLAEKQAVLTVDDAAFSVDAAKAAVREEGYAVVSAA